jgi:hypothetical protein
VQAVNYAWFPPVMKSWRPMKRGSIWCKRKVEAASGVPDIDKSVRKISELLVFSSNDSKHNKKR